MATTRKTRIVCISDTHNQTPKLPSGDVLIHAGDMTTQGSYAELRKTVEWLEKTEFQAKIVIAGNHDITLDHHSSTKRKPNGNGLRLKIPQKLLTDSPSITYLENEAADIYLTKPQICFRVFGSPYSPGQRGWGFQYWGEQEAERVWAHSEMDDADIVVTHTPAYGYCDIAMEGERAGCVALTRRLEVVRPMLYVCGHIHDARGFERVRWGPGASVIEPWTDPGEGNKKISLIDLTEKSGHAIENAGRGVARYSLPKVSAEALEGQSDQNKSNSTLNLADDNSAIGQVKPEMYRKKAGGAIEYRHRRTPGGGGHDSVDAVQAGERNETAVINAALLSARTVGKASTFDKPIVIDVELPIWRFDGDVDEVRWE